ncbi:MAG: hypothetical protein AAGG11_24340 [Pseudomonadota bacterium]
MSDVQPGDEPVAAGQGVSVNGAYDAAQLEQALADPELLPRALAWAGLTVARIDRERLRAAATGFSAIVSARVAPQSYEVLFEEETSSGSDARPPTALTLRFEPIGVDPAAATEWTAVLDPLPADAGAQARHWLPKVLLALPEQLMHTAPPAPERSGNGRWIWIVAFVVLLLALALAV